jgi:hypothetical protein
MDTRLHLFTHRRLRYSPTDRLRIVKKQMTGGSGMDAVFEAGRPGPRPSRSTAFARAAQSLWAATSRARCRLRILNSRNLPLKIDVRLRSCPGPIQCQDERFAHGDFHQHSGVVKLYGVPPSRWIRLSKDRGVPETFALSRKPPRKCDDPHPRRKHCKQQNNQKG